MRLPRLLCLAALLGAAALTRPSQGEEVPRGPGSLHMPPFVTHDHYWEWVNSAALERPLVVLLVNPLESGGAASVRDRMAGLNGLAGAGIETIVVTWRGNFGANREFATRNTAAMPVLFSLPDPALADWVEGWTGELPTALLFLDGGPAVAWGDPVALGAVAMDLRAGLALDDPAYQALLQRISDPAAAVPPAPPSLLGDWLLWREYRATHRAELRLTQGQGEVSWEHLLEEGRLLLSWAPALSDSLLRWRTDTWLDRITTTSFPEGANPTETLAPILPALAALAERLTPSFRGWLHLIHDRPAAAHAEFLVAGEELGVSSWVRDAHILVAAAIDPNLESPVASAPDLAFAYYREVPPNDRTQAFRHLATDLTRVSAWWGDTREFPPSYAFTLGMSLAYIGHEAAPDYLDPLRPDPVWGPLVARVDALLGRN